MVTLAKLVVSYTNVIYRALTPVSFTSSASHFTLSKVLGVVWCVCVCVCRVDGLVKAVRQPLLTLFTGGLLFFSYPLLPSTPPRAADRGWNCYKQSVLSS